MDLAEIGKLKEENEELKSKVVALQEAHIVKLDELRQDRDRLYDENIRLNSKLSEMQAAIKQHGERPEKSKSDNTDIRSFYDERRNFAAIDRVCRSYGFDRKALTSEQKKSLYPIIKGAN